MRYQIKLVNTNTNESRLTTFGFTNRKEAEKWCESWRALGKLFDCEIVDRKRNNVVNYSLKAWCTK